ncbi:MAG: hypothetical protein ABI304_01815 [Rudaea sp.]
MKKYSTILIFGVCCATAFAAAKPGFERITSAEYTQKLHDGMHAYNRHDYARAFPLLKRAACAGDKTSQALVGQMFILGQGTPKDDLTGYAWIKTAAEFHFPDFTRLARKLERALSPERRTLGSERAQQFLADYGMRPTQMACRGESRHGAHMIDTVVCTPPDAGGPYVWVHRCVEPKSQR